jgi:hypothetical protein
MDRLQCEIRLMRPGDESVLYLLAEQNLRPLASRSGHPERYHPDELVHLLRDADVLRPSSPPATRLRCTCTAATISQARPSRTAPS